MRSVFETNMLRDLANTHQTPLFIYSKKDLRSRVKSLVTLNLPHGWTPRFAVKANNHPEIIKLLDAEGIAFDTSSSYETQELLDLGIEGAQISLSSQQPAHNLSDLLSRGVRYIATSMHQLKLFADVAQPGSDVGLRVNPGLGAGHNNRTTTGGANSSFGLWNTYLPEALKFATENGLSITTLHIHIGSGADPKVWEATMLTALELVRHMPDVVKLDIGGGFKIHRYSDEHESDMTVIAKVFDTLLRDFEKETGRQLHLEVEPGTWLVGHAGVLLSNIVDIVDTGDDGHVFLKLDTGMNDIIRPSMYGAQHEIEVLNDSSETQDYVVVGHNCETGDILTPAPGDPEGIEPRTLKKATIGDVVALYDAGAYCRSFATKGYNSFPAAKEILV